MATASSSTPGWRPTPRASSRPARPASTGISATAPLASAPAMTTPPHLHRHRHPPERKYRHRKGDGPDPGPVLLKLRVAEGRIVDLSLTFGSATAPGWRRTRSAWRPARQRSLSGKTSTISTGAPASGSSFACAAQVPRGAAAGSLPLGASGPSTSPGRARRASVFFCGTGRPARWPPEVRGLTAAGTTSRSSSTARPGGSRSAPMAARRSG